MDETLRQLIIQELGLATKSQEESDAIISALGGLILKLAFVTITETLNDEDVVEFDRIVTEGDQDKVSAFLIEHVEDLDAIMAKSSRDVIEEFKKK